MGVWRYLSTACLAVALLACEDKHPPAGLSGARSARPAGSVAALAASRAPPIKALNEIRERKLSLEPRRGPGQLLAFAGQRLAALREDKVVIYDVASFSQKLAAPLPGAQRITSFSDGTLLAVGAEDVIRVDKKDQVERFARLPLLPGSRLFTDPLEEGRFWVLPGFGDTLYSYELGPAAAGLLPMGEFITLAAFDHEAFAALKDGSFLYTASDKLVRFFPKGKKVELPAPRASSKVWRLLRAHRIDQVWAAYQDGQLRLITLTAGAPVARELELTGDAFDIASSDRYLAVIAVSRDDKAGRRFSLEVFDAKGKLRMSAPLPKDPVTSAGDDWVEQATLNKHVVLAPDKPLVAVGGPSFLAVWNIESKKQLTTSD